MTTNTGPKGTYGSDPQSERAASEIIEQIGDVGSDSLRLIVFFATVEHDGQRIGDLLRKKYPAAQVIGSSGNGEFSNRGYGTGGVAALALGSDVLSEVATALAVLDKGVQTGIETAAQALSAQLGVPIRELDPQTHVGLALLEGATLREEKINEELGNVAPFLSFVGGSAGDRLRFEKTWVYAEGVCHSDACALAVIRPLRPFGIVKTCHFTAKPIEVTITKCEPDKRLVHELDGRPAAERYAELVGVKPEELGFATYLGNPFGLMIDGEPWLRSIVRVEGQSLFFSCAILEGMTLNLMQAHDILENATSVYRRASASLDAPPKAAILFNCALRMLEVRIKGIEAEYHKALSVLPHVGLHSNGESYLGHINQTLTGLIFT